MENKIEIRSVDKFYGRKQALYDINLTINQGMFGLLGRNGAGKTTLMKTLATLHQKRNGSITDIQINIFGPMSFVTLGLFYVCISFFEERDCIHKV